MAAKDIAATLGLSPDPGAPGTPPLSPADQRRVENGEKPIGPPDSYEVTQLSEADAWDMFGRPTLSPPPNSPDGTPVPQEPRREYEPARRPAEGAALNAPTPEESAAEVMRAASEEARSIRAAAKADAARSMRHIVAAAKSGDAEAMAKAQRDGEGAVSLLRRVQDKIGF